MRNLLFVAVMAGLIVLASCDGVNLPVKRYSLEILQTETALPNYVNVLFRVTKNDEGVPDLTEDDFYVQENYEEVGSEAGVTIVPFDDIPFSVRTVLLLDISKSVETNLDEIKAAANALIDNMTENQEVMIATFSSGYAVVQDFSKNQLQLKEAIDNISIGTSSTNLYGSVVQAAQNLRDEYDLCNIVASNLIIFTDGDDTQASSTLTDAQNAVVGKDVYVIALNGPDFDSDAASNLQAIQTKGYFEARRVSKLQDLFLDINERIESLAKSVYWLYFESPKRGNATHDLTVGVKGAIDDYEGEDSRTFSSEFFTDNSGANPTPNDPCSGNSGGGSQQSGTGILQGANGNQINLFGDHQINAYTGQCVDNCDGASIPEISYFETVADFSMQGEKYDGYSGSTLMQLNYYDTFDDYQSTIIEGSIEVNSIGNGVLQVSFSPYNHSFNVVLYVEE